MPFPECGAITQGYIRYHLTQFIQRELKNRNIDKDRSSAKLALDMKSDMLVILTAVDRVYVNFNKPNQKELIEIDSKEARKYIEQGH